VLALLLVKPAWGLGGGILTLLAVFGEKIFPVRKAPPQASAFFSPRAALGPQLGRSSRAEFRARARKRMQTRLA
jgi:hypothetical protein